jgi:HD-like signal output (HDOD) protein/CheY-like chemotaxis protein
MTTTPGDKIRILFVDDEPAILDGLRNRLRRLRSSFEMTFAEGGTAALQLLETSTFDVVVTDMRMPVVDGTVVLKKTHAVQPHAIRIVLSGHADLESVLRVVPVAHRYLMKPCDPDELQQAILRARTLRSIVNNERVRSVLGGVRNLPPAPRLYATLTRVIESENASMDDVARVLADDVAMSAKILQLVNSAFMRTNRRVTTVAEAVRYLGFATTKSLVLAAEVFNHPGKAGKAVEQAQQHALAVAKMASSLFTDKRLAQEAFLAGMMHDVGTLVLLAELPDQLTEITRRERESGVSRSAAEEAVIGATHADLGAYLLTLWGMPDELIEAVACHHCPGRLPHDSFALVDALHVADGLIAECSGEASGLDTEWLSKLGVSKEIDAWRTRALGIVHPEAA